MDRKRPASVVSVGEEKTSSGYIITGRIASRHVTNGGIAQNKQKKIEKRFIFPRFIYFKKLIKTLFHYSWLTTWLNCYAVITRFDWSIWFLYPNDQCSRYYTYISLFSKEYYRFKFNLVERPWQSMETALTFFIIIYQLQIGETLNWHVHFNICIIRFPHWLEIKFNTRRWFESFHHFIFGLGGR